NWRWWRSGTSCSSPQEGWERRRAGRDLGVLDGERRCGRGAVLCAARLTNTGPRRPKLYIEDHIGFVGCVNPWCAAGLRWGSAAECGGYAVAMIPSEDLGASGEAFALQSGTLSRRGLREHVYDSVLDMLLRGETTPGTRLSIDTIARQLDVSPTPVREALVQLERTGLVTRQARQGYRVAPPLGPDQLLELFEAPEMLEGTATRRAAPAAHEFLPELRQAQERHRRSGEAVIEALDAGVKNVALTTEYYARDQEFHDIIISRSGNRYLLDISHSLGALVHRLRSTVHRGVTDVRDAIVEHEAIIEALATEDPDAAAEAMRSHVQKVRERALGDAGDARREARVELADD